MNRGIVLLSYDVISKSTPVADEPDDPPKVRKIPAMRRMPLITAAVTVTLLLVGVSPVAAQLEGFEILPQPKRVSFEAGPGLTVGGLHTLVLGAGTKRPAAMPSLLDPLPTGTGTGAGVLLLTRGSTALTPEHPEGYELVITGNFVRISGRGEAGLFYGCQTLQQLLEDARDRGAEIPAMRIIDWPEIDYRAVHFDVKHHLDRMEYYYDAIDRLAAMKINAVIFELEDKLRYRRQPVVGADNAMSIEEVAALTRYARDRHIEISPLVQGLGHAAFILKHEEYHDLRDDPTNDWAFDPLNERTYEVQFDLYLDAIEATPGSRYLHIGGDEVEVGASEAGRASGLSSFELQMQWLERVAAFAAEHDRIPIMWDDMPLKHAGVWSTIVNNDYTDEEVDRIWEKGWQDLAESIDLFPTNSVYMRWNYWAPTLRGNIRTLEWYRAHGLQAMTATAAQTTWPIHPRQGGNTVSIRDFNRLTAEHDLDGILCTAWDDSSPHMEFYWRGWMAHAEYAWSPNGRSIEEFNAAYGQRRFGPAGREMAPAVHYGLEAALNAGDVILRQRRGRRGPFRTPADAFEAALTMPDPDAPGAWRERNAGRLVTARTELDRYRVTAAIFDELMNRATRGRFALRLMSALNDVQAFAWRLLLATAECDTRGRDAAGPQLMTEIERFAEAEANFLAVFGETRFLNNPPGYQLDQNRSPHLANVRNDPSWIFAIESGYCARALAWLER